MSQPQRSSEAGAAPRMHRDGDRWLITVGDVTIGEVYKARFRSDRYPYGEAQIWGRGRTRWMASTVNDEDFDTRRDAVAEMVRRWWLANELDTSPGA